MSVNSFPKDRDYRREVMQATTASGFASGSMCANKIFLCQYSFSTSIFKECYAFCVCLLSRCCEELSDLCVGIAIIPMIYLTVIS